MDLTRLNRIKVIARELLGEVEWISIGTRNPDYSIKVGSRIYPGEMESRVFVRNLDKSLAKINPATEYWSDANNDEDLGASLALQIIGQSLEIIGPVRVQLSVKFRRFNRNYALGTEHDSVPPVADQLAGKRPQPLSELN